MNRGGLGARSLNIDLQKALNPPGQEKIEKFGSTFAPKDKVMQIENDYDKEVYNGDVGFITKIDAEEGEIAVKSTAAKSPTRAANSTAWSSRTQPPSISRKARNIRPSSCRLRPSITHASAQSSVHGPHARKAAGRARRAEKGGSDRHEQCFGRKRWSKLREWLSEP